MKKNFTVPAQLIKIDQDTNYVITKSGNYTFELVAPQISFNLFSAIKASGDEQFDLEILIRHLAPEIKAKVVLKAVGFDRSKISLKAKILIEPNCPKTQSFLTERVLLVSPEAKALAIPNLEILTDDVRCSHTASISTISENQIFYLTSRGLSHCQAETMIVEGFLEEN